MRSGRPAFGSLRRRATARSRGSSRRDSSRTSSPRNSEGISLRDTGRAMSEESTPPGLVKLVRRLNDAWNRRDVDAFLSVVAPDVVYRPITTWPEPQERDEVRRFFIADSVDAWTDDFTSKPETIRVHGNSAI